MIDKDKKNQQPMNESYEINFAKEDEAEEKETLEHGNLSYADEPEHGHYTAYEKSEAVQGHLSKMNDNMEYMDVEGFLKEEDEHHDMDVKLDEITRKHEEQIAKEELKAKNKLLSEQNKAIDQVFDSSLKEQLGEELDQEHHKTDEHEIVSEASKDFDSAEKIYRSKDVFQGESGKVNANMEYMEEEGFLKDKE